jgi:hypothetical protein
MSRLIRRDKASRAAAYIKGAACCYRKLYCAKIIFPVKKCHAVILIISIPNRFCKMLHFVDHAFHKRTASLDGQRRAWRHHIRL